MDAPRSADAASSLSAGGGRLQDLSSCKFLVSKLESTKNKKNLMNSVRLLERNEAILTSIRQVDAEGQDGGSAPKASRLEHILELNANLGELHRIFTSLSN